MATTSAPHAQHAVPTHEPPAALRAAGILAVLTVVLATIAIAFALPATKSAPHDVPIGIAGPQAANGQITERLDRQAPGAFAVTYFPGETALRDAILHRDVYGGVSVGPDGPRLLIATGAGPAVAQMLTQLGNGLAQQTGANPPVGPLASGRAVPPSLLPAGAPIPTEDLAPPTADDPRGVGLPASALPITLAGLLPAVALVLVLRREVWTRLAAVILYAPVAGLTVAALLRYAFGSIDQNLWGVAAALSLGVLASGLLLLGLGSLFGRPGLIAGAVLAVLLGNPLSGLASAPELLPSGWGQLGQLLPQGATATLLRSAAFFSGNGAGTAIAVLTCWAVFGATLVVIAAMRHSRVT